MKLNQWRQLSLRRTLLLVLLPGMLLVVAGELWLTWRNSLDAANAAFDRSLLGAIKAIDANISNCISGRSGQGQSDDAGFGGSNRIMIGESNAGSR